MVKEGLEKGWRVPLLFFLLLLSFGTAQAFAFELVSGQAGGAPANGDSYQPVLSGDGRYVAFVSDADNLDPADVVPSWGVDPDVFLFDRQSGEVELATGQMGTTGFFVRNECLAPALSHDGRYLAFQCFSGSFFAHRLYYEVYLQDRLSGQTLRVSRGAGGQQGNGSSEAPSLDGAGERLVFASEASNLVAGDGNGVRDIFLFSRQDGTLSRVSVAAGAGEANGPSDAPAISADGRHVAFSSRADNLVPGDTNGVSDIFVRDLESGEVERISAPGGGSAGAPAISADGRWVAFFAEDGAGQELVLFDRQAGSVLPVSRMPAGGVGREVDPRPAISADGRLVVFSSSVDPQGGAAAGVSNIYRFDRLSGRIACLAPEADGPSAAPAVSAGGGMIAFSSRADNLADGGGTATTDILLYADLSDTVPPTVSLEPSQGILWPPNKKYVPVRIDGIAQDDSGQVSVEISVSDEYGEMVGMLLPGFGSTVELEAWREGDDMDGRVYTITAVATDGAGNQSAATAEVVVPHDMRGNARR